MKDIGCWYRQGTVTWKVWAPRRQAMAVEVVAPGPRTIAMRKDEQGYWTAQASDLNVGTRYLYRLDDSLSRPDPASFYQPQGVHQPSEIIDHNGFQWSDEKWIGLDWKRYIIYELHIGTFTEQGTFAAACSRLAQLKELGVTAIELMPISQFPGTRNWGYDEVYPFSVQNSYGGPHELKRFVDAAHQQGMAVMLDVVYNHLGPEGNYFADFGPYFTNKYEQLWGPTLNFDGPQSQLVRQFFIQNALFWFQYYHIDALRLDAIQGIIDNSQKHFLQELAEAVEQYSQQQQRQYYLVPESDLNDSRVIRTISSGGYGLTAQWNDDFHHALHTALTTERNGHYADFNGTQDIVKAINQGFVYSGQYSHYRGCKHGNASDDLAAHKFVVSAQNHDQVGNRINGKRLTQLVDFTALKAVAALVLLGPNIPLLFMGEEYGDTAPFLYFVSHSDEQLIEGVRQGRKQWFKKFAWHQAPPDPQSEQTFLSCRLHWSLKNKSNHHVLWQWYSKLIAARKQCDLAGFEEYRSYLRGKEGLIVEVQYSNNQSIKFIILISFNGQPSTLTIEFTEQPMHKILDSAQPQWAGTGSQLPETVQSPQEIMLQPYQCAMFEL